MWFIRDPYIKALFIIGWQANCLCRLPKSKEVNLSLLRDNTPIFLSTSYVNDLIILINWEIIAIDFEEFAKVGTYRNMTISSFSLDEYITLLRKDVSTKLSYGHFFDIFTLFETF